MKRSRSSTLETRRFLQSNILLLVTSILIISIQIYWIYLTLYYLYGAYHLITVGIELLAVIVSVYIYGRHTTSGMKVPWIILILTVPVFGLLMYLLVGFNGWSHFAKKRYLALDEAAEKILCTQPVLLDHSAASFSAAAESDDADPSASASEQDMDFFRQAGYLYQYAHYPAYADQRVTYHSDAAAALEDLLIDLKSARHFIFMEYHAIEDAEGFDRIEEVLTEQAKVGVTVRLFYDEVGSVGFLNRGFIRKMEERGIECRVFNPLRPVLSTFLNNRDHRKITVIDGRIAYTGGYNLAREYFHLTEPYGYWKDSGLRIEGTAAGSFTVMFLCMWHSIQKEKDTHAAEEELRQFLTPISLDRIELPSVQNLVRYCVPYADSPLDEERVGEWTYMNLLESARKQIWFVTPYLVITDEMQQCFLLAARRGVDVRIITPGIPDKKLTYAVTRSFYASLIDNGVKIYEYTPGFCHAKMCLCDNEMAVVGTINLDYRSFYHHFEDGVLLYQGEVIDRIREDFENMFSLSRQVALTPGRRSRTLRIGQCLLRLLAPLL